MSVKHKIEKLEEASLGVDQELIIAFECLDDRGKYKVRDHEDLGLISFGELEECFEDAVIIYVTYRDF